MYKKNSFTLVEILIVVAILGLLTAIAVPNVIKSRNIAWENACKSNREMIGAAIEQWALDENKPSSTTITSGAQAGGWYDYLKDGVPHCPKGNSTSGAYKYGPVDGTTYTLGTYTITCPLGH